MSYPFVPAANDYGPRQGPALAFVIHMAEGGGTVGYLSRPNPRGVSVHYVIEYSGRTVRMLDEDHASGSINPQDIRTTDGPAPYGITVARAALGTWIRDPNSAVLSCELEGFAADGPNAAQCDALDRLVDDLRTRYPAIALLGHRDFQHYKACPGARIPWDRLGGHGIGDPSMGLLVTLRSPLELGTLAIPKGTDAINVATGGHYSAGQAVMRPAVTAALTGGQAESGYLVDLDGDRLHFIRSSAAGIAWTPAAAGDCGPVVESAISADRAKAHIVYG